MEHGVRYPADPLKPESVGLDFYNGMPGIVAFYAALHHATQDPAWFAAAEAGATYLLHAVATGGDTMDCGLYRTAATSVLNLPAAIATSTIVLAGAYPP